MRVAVAEGSGGGRFVEGRRGSRGVVAREGV